ncbi:30S ribosomal protein S17e [Candidatus Woesearchaeota archaeon]|nr:30S ribosomal protein S17e [Candidatus Woesearchaeota archaeon]
MGRIKTSLIKRVTRELLEKHKQEFTEDFNKNKAIVSKHAIIQSKKLRNVVAGYATHVVRRGDERRPRTRPALEEMRGGMRGRRTRHSEDNY